MPTEQTSPTTIPACVDPRIQPGIRVVSFPKSGRTWLRVMLDDLQIRLVYTHADSGHLKRHHFSECGPLEEVFTGHQIILLIRDPRDVTVSGYFHSKKRIKIFDGNLSDFIRNERHGISKVLAFNELAVRSLCYASRYLVLRYEDLRARPINLLNQIMRFVGFPLCTKQTINKIVERYAFENMQRLEQKGYFRDEYGFLLGSKTPQDLDSLKVRRGKVGGYRDDMNELDLQYCNQLMAVSDYVQQFNYLESNKDA